jgi:phage terminase small subunit
MGVAGKKGSKKAGKRKPAKKQVEPKVLPVVTDELSPRRQMFVEYYLGECRFNGTAAARAAGYEGDDNVLAVTASRLLRNAKVRALIDSRISEAAMSANEVLSRLSEIARGRVTDFVDDDGKFDLRAAKKLQKDGLLKKLKQKRTSKKVDRFTEGKEDYAETFETSLVYEEVEFEIYSAHEALRDLGKYHKLFTEKYEHSGEDGKPIPISIIEAVKPKA